jgi:hypothetical protein
MQTLRMDRKATGIIICSADKGLIYRFIKNSENSVIGKPKNPVKNRQNN